MVKKCLIEFVGTFFLLLTVGLTGNPVAIGVVLVSLVYMGGYISGAHYNPAVTAAVYVTKKIDRQAALLYILMQFVAAFTASGMYLLMKNAFFLPKPAVHISPMTAILVETLFTFFLASVVLHTAYTKKTEGNQYYGLAIGLSLMVGAFAGGPISGGAFNPAVGIAPQLFDITRVGMHTMNILIYLVGPLLGGILAGAFYKAINNK